MVPDGCAVLRLTPIAIDLHRVSLLPNEHYPRWQARAKANGMSVSQLRAELTKMGVNSDGAVEKNDLVVLYMRGRKNPTPPATATGANGNGAAGARAPPARPATQARAPANPVQLPKEINWGEW